MKKEMKWGLATLILLLGIAAVFLFIDKDTNTEPKMTLGQPTKDLLKQGVKSPQQAETPVAVEELPPSKEAHLPSSENSEIKEGNVKEHFQDGVLYDENHNPIKMTPELEDKLNKQAKQDFYTQIRGVSGPPPAGYKYRITHDGKAMLDENGKPMIYKIGEPIFSLETQKGFAPTLEQYKKYQSLLQNKVDAMKNNDYDKADNIQSEIDQFRKDARGELPYINITLTLETSSESEMDAAYKRALELSKPIMYEAYRKQGFAHLIPEEYK